MLLVSGPLPPLAFPFPTHTHTQKKKKKKKLKSRTTRCELREEQVNTNKQLPRPRTRRVLLAASLFSTGFILGPIIDGIHSGVKLVVYQNGAIDIGPLHTNVWVPPLLGFFYLLVGFLQLSLDHSNSNKATPTPQKTASSLIALLLFIQLSAQLYKAGTPDNLEAYSLFAAAQLMWLLFDNTATGFLLASILGIVCPLAEIPFMKLFNLWYYPNANVEIFGQGLVTWTITCYFAYAPFLINLSRYLKSLLASNSHTQT